MLEHLNYFTNVVAPALIGAIGCAIGLLLATGLLLGILFFAGFVFFQVITGK